MCAGMTVFDRLALRLRPLFFVGAALSLPVFLVSYAYGLKLLFQAVPGWLFLIIAAAHVTVAIGASCLHDFQQERRSLRPRSR